MGADVFVSVMMMLVMMVGRKLLYCEDYAYDDEDCASDVAEVFAEILELAVVTVDCVETKYQDVGNEDDG